MSGNPIFDNRNYPAGHPISPQRAKELLEGDLGDVLRSLVRGCMAPLFWHRRSSTALHLPLHNGTMTLATVGGEIIGVTAEHVVQQFEADNAHEPVALQVFGAPFSFDVIDRSSELDLATLRISEEMLSNWGKPVIPLQIHPYVSPQEGRGILLGGYPGNLRRPIRDEIEWGIFTAFGIARRVTDKQVTWRLDRDYDVPHPLIASPPPNADLGGISGGPMIGVFETEHHFAYHKLVGIVVEASSELENVVAIKTEFIREDGKIRKGL